MKLAASAFVRGCSKVSVESTNWTIPNTMLDFKATSFMKSPRRIFIAGLNMKKPELAVPLAKAPVQGYRYEKNPTISTRDETK